MEEIIQPILTRVSARDIVFGEEVSATIYGKRYNFRFGQEEDIIVTRDRKELRFLIKEIERLEHVNMPFIKLVDCQFPSISKQRASDIALRLHLIMPGDTFECSELVTYIGAGTQRSSNYYFAE